MTDIKVFWAEAFHTITVKNEHFRVRVGYKVKENTYLVISDKHPRFCFEDAYLEVAMEKARRALEFYLKHGLRDIDYIP